MNVGAFRKEQGVYLKYHRENLKSVWHQVIGRTDPALIPHEGGPRWAVPILSVLTHLGRVWRGGLDQIRLGACPPRTQSSSLSGQLQLTRFRSSSSEATRMLSTRGITCFGE